MSVESPSGSALSTQLSDPPNANTIWDKFLQAPTLRGNKIKIDILKSDSRMSTFSKTKEKKNEDKKIDSREDVWITHEIQRTLMIYFKTYLQIS